MKIAFTGGGTGGHFYPLIAVAEEVNAIVQEGNLLQPELFYFANSPYDEEMLQQQNLQYHHVAAGKMRTYVSVKNGVDFFKTLVGFPTALHLLFKIYPDVLFSKGGYVSVPVVLAARILKIPVFVHDSDMVPGRANLWAGKFAERIGVSYPEAGDAFARKDRVACVGNPVRREVQKSEDRASGYKHFGLQPGVPTVLVLGGSQGAEHINSTFFQAATELLDTYQIIHQVGPKNHESYVELASVELRDSPHKDRYKVLPHLNPLDLRMAAGVADLVVSRAGSGSIFEISLWEVPAILIPIPEDVSRDQRENAYAYARAGAAEVIEQHNCTPHVLRGEIDRIMADAPLLQKMRVAAKGFQRPHAARTVAQELIRMALEHEL